MPVKTLSGYGREIPATMATQHPDNASKPHWSHRSDARVTAEMEADEAYRNFSHLDIDETMWDNEGKYVDRDIGQKLVETHTDYFRQRQIGKDVFITYRIPNRWKQKGGIYRQALNAITSENETLAEYGFHSPAFFEVILPFTENPYQLVGVQHDYVVNTSHDRNPRHLELIPLIEGAARLSDIQEILDGYTHAMQIIWGARPAYIRAFIARSDPALDSGAVPADLFALGSVSECYKVGQRSGIDIFPIIGAGPSNFRGGLTPQSVDEFVAKYPGFRTVTIQSAFRYDHKDDEVKAAVGRLKELLPQSEPRILDDSQMICINDLIEIFSRHYRSTIMHKEDGKRPVADTVIEVASDKYIPSNRERAGHVGHFGYGRRIEGAEESEDSKLPRAIKYVAAFMTLGIPPEIIGTGRGIAEAGDRNLLHALENILPYMRDDLKKSLRYLHRDNLGYLARSSEAWASVEEDVRVIDHWLGEQIEPQTSNEMIHSMHAGNFLTYYSKTEDHKFEDEARQEAQKAAELRRYLG